MVTILALGLNPASALISGFCICLIMLAVIDQQTGYLPDTLTIGGLWAGLLASLGGGIATPKTAILGAAAGYGVFWLLNHAYCRLKGEEGIGQGDFKFLAMIGAWLGITALPMVLAIGAGAGAVWHYGQRLVGLSKDDRVVPFGPWLALGALATLAMTLAPRWLA